MSENVHAIVGIIEISNFPGGATAEVDDSSLDRLLASLAEHDSLADDCEQLPSRGGWSGWRRTGDDSVYDGKTSVATDLGTLVAELEQEYAQLCQSLRS